MRFEKLDINNGSKYKWLLCGLIMGVALIIIINFLMSYAKYKAVDSVKLASGTVNYTRADFSLIGIKVQEKNEDGSGKTIEGGLGKDYKDTDHIPEDSTYEFNAENTYCTIGDNVHVTGREALLEAGITITYENSTGFIFSGIKQTNTKCYVYFDVKGSSDKTLANLNLSSQGESKKKFGGTACSSGCSITDENGLFEAPDEDGTTYYYRGTVDNNWVKFGTTKDGSKDIYWRIIRINGNGTIRLIYAGEGDILSSSPTIKNALDSQAYNEIENDNKYVGFMYGGQKGISSSSYGYDGAHANETKSDMLVALYDWWNDSTNLDSLLNKIDGTTGFCNDRQAYIPSSPSTLDIGKTTGYGTVYTHYGPFVRAYQTHQPTFLCAQKDKDLFTLSTDRGQGNGALEKPIGLITMDELMYAGGYYGTNNTGYWLNSNTYFWTMSPSSFAADDAYVFYVYATGNINYTQVRDGTGVRPVINLKSNTKFTTLKEEAKGTVTNPYIVQ